MFAREKSVSNKLNMFLVISRFIVGAVQISQGDVVIARGVTVLFKGRRERQHFKHKRKLCF